MLGSGLPDVVISPTQIAGLKNIVDLAAGGGHLLALASDGTLWSWGYNSNGQLGTGGTVDRSVPTAIDNFDGAMYIDAGARHSLVIKRDGTVWGWGAGEQGQLGHWFYQDFSTPVAISLDPD